MANKKKRNFEKELFLDRYTSHGGWPEGNNTDWLGKGPVNKIIYNYLKSMGLTADVPHARLSESKIRKIIIESIKSVLQ